MKQLQRKTIGKSNEGRELVAHILGSHDANRCIMVLGGFHGDEPKSVHIVQRLIAELTSKFESARGNPDMESRKLATRWVLMPLVNPDGFERKSRRNARKVDLNRSFPTKNWKVGNPRSRMFGGFKPASEAETRGVIRLIEKYRPHVIVTIHSINRNRYCNNYDGPGRRLAQRLSRKNKYPVTSTIGYPTPGSFGTWAGVERKIPTITLELPSHHSAKQCWDDNCQALLSLGL